MKIAAILSGVIMFTVLVFGVLSNRSRTAQKIETLKEEVARYTQVIDTAPTDAQTYYSRAMTYRKLKDYHKAIADFTKVIQLDPQNALAYKYRGLTYGFLGKNDQCYTDFFHSLEIEQKRDGQRIQRTPVLQKEVKASK